MDINSAFRKALARNLKSARTPRLLKAVKITKHDSRSVKKAGKFFISEPEAVRRLNSLIDEQTFRDALDNVPLHHTDDITLDVMLELPNNCGYIKGYIPNPDVGNMDGMWTVNCPMHEKLYDAKPEAYEIVLTDVRFSEQSTNQPQVRTYGDVLVVGHMFTNFEVLFWEGDVMMNAKATNISLENPPAEWQVFFADLIAHDCNMLSEGTIKDDIMLLPFMGIVPVQFVFKAKRLDNCAIVLSITKDAVDTDFSNLGINAREKTGEWSVGELDAIPWEAVFVREYWQNGMRQAYNNRIEEMDVKAKKFDSIDEVIYALGIDWGHPTIVNCKYSLNDRLSTMDCAEYTPEALGQLLAENHKNFTRHEHGGVIPTAKSVRKSARKPVEMSIEQMIASKRKQ